jgi:hypothetical protein
VTLPSFNFRPAAAAESTTSTRDRGRLLAVFTRLQENFRQVRNASIAAVQSRLINGRVRPEAAIRFAWRWTTLPLAVSGIFEQIQPA